MTALSASYDAKRKPGHLVNQPVGASKVIYKGGLTVIATSTGLAQAGADASGVVFVGVAYETCDNTGGAASAKSVRLEKTGVYTYAKTGATATDIGKTAYIVDDNTVNTSATTNSVPCGVVVGVVDTGHVAVRIDGKVN